MSTMGAPHQAHRLLVDHLRISASGQLKELVAYYGRPVHAERAYEGFASGLHCSAWVSLVDLFEEHAVLDQSFVPCSPHHSVLGSLGEMLFSLFAS